MGLARTNRGRRCRRLRSLALAPASTKDVAAGYRLIVGVRIQPPKVILGWIDLEPLKLD